MLSPFYRLGKGGLEKCRNCVQEIPLKIQQCMYGCVSPACTSPWNCTSPVNAPDLLLPNRSDTWGCAPSEDYSLRPSRAACCQEACEWQDTPGRRHRQPLPGIRAQLPQILITGAASFLYRAWTCFVSQHLQSDLKLVPCARCS